MIGHELAVEQLKSAKLQPRHKPGECHLRSIGRAAEHAFTKIGAAHGEAVKPADQLAVEPAFHAMCLPLGMESYEGRFDIGVDPCFTTAVGRLGAFFDDGLESQIAGHAEPFVPYRFRQRA